MAAIARRAVCFGVVCAAECAAIIRLRPVGGLRRRSRRWLRRWTRRGLVAGAGPQRLRTTRCRSCAWSISRRRSGLRIARVRPRPAVIWISAIAGRSSGRLVPAHFIHAARASVSRHGAGTIFNILVSLVSALALPIVRIISGGRPLGRAADVPCGGALRCTPNVSCCGPRARRIVGLIIHAAFIRRTVAHIVRKGPVRIVVVRHRPRFIAGIQISVVIETIVVVVVDVDVDVVMHVDRRPVVVVGQARRRNNRDDRVAENTAAGRTTRRRVPRLGSNNYCC